MKYSKIFFSFILILSFLITCQINGWLLLIFGFFFVVTFLFQLKLIWVEELNRIKTPVIIIYIAIIIMFLFRQDFGDSNVSGINAFSFISYKLGHRESKYFVDNTTTYDLVLNSLWIVIIPIQVYLLWRSYRIKK